MGGGFLGELKGESQHGWEKGGPGLKAFADERGNIATTTGQDGAFRDRRTSTFGWLHD